MLTGFQTLLNTLAAKNPSTSFSPATFTKVGISPQTFWLLVLTLLPNWCKN